MSRSSLNVIPESVRNELLSRYLNQSYLTMNDHLSWLAEQGHLVSRSSLHRYLVTHKGGALGAEQHRQDAMKAEELMRFRCLEIAARLYQGNDRLELIDLADELLDWIISTEASKDPLA
ncbi:DUF3486 family protein [Pseudomonas protegens]|uniref:DUF3486 family protein n=1 Tax=Pseudomonas protegens TaxID=380021 RepID=UPI00209B4EF6|nr:MULTISPECIES: DUF3486 family protein [Pseudomonas chlororaphis group]MCO7612908.1 DUF3486 family protein [Pseudomonas chlororaphis]MDS9879407.1 DUF3486 family protein [Pseudomonas protegens]